MGGQLASLERLFLALSDKTRLRLLGLMANGEVSVGFLSEQTGESQPKVSRHLAYLRNAGIVATRRDGKWIYYSISPPDDPPSANVLASLLANLSGDAFDHAPKVRPYPEVIASSSTEPEADRDPEEPAEVEFEDREEMEVFLL